MLYYPEDSLSTPERLIHALVIKYPRETCGSRDGHSGLFDQPGKLLPLCLALRRAPLRGADPNLLLVRTELRGKYYKCPEGSCGMFYKRYGHYKIHWRLKHMKPFKLASVGL
jgi:hypothetical protein